MNDPPIKTLLAHNFTQMLALWNERMIDAFEEKGGKANDKGHGAEVDKVQSMKDHRHRRIDMDDIGIDTSAWMLSSYHMKWKLS